MPEVFTWQNADAQRAIEQVIAHLSDGRLVGLPTDTFYRVFGRLQTGVLQQLAALDAESASLTLAMGSPHELSDWAPAAGTFANRLARRCWPGPLTLICTRGIDTGKLSSQPPESQEMLGADKSLRMRVHDHDIPLEVSRILQESLVAAEPSKPLRTAQDVVECYGDKVAWLIDAGPAVVTADATEVVAEADSVKVRREGLIPSSLLDDLTRCHILFVCTGNTCRSPLAAALCSKMLAEHFGCKPDELRQRGFIVLSAGLAAAAGGPATEEAIQVGRQFGVDLTFHRSQPLTLELLNQADHLFLMTDSHLKMLERVPVQMSCEASLLCPDGKDVADPFGGTAEVYRQCADEILKSLQRRLPEFQYV